MTSSSSEVPIFAPVDDSKKVMGSGVPGSGVPDAEHAEGAKRQSALDDADGSADEVFVVTLMASVLHLRRLTAYV